MVNDCQPVLRRIETWVVTGPVGHLLSAIGDWAVVLTTLARDRIRRLR